MSNSTQNDHETHTACIGRIKKEGASSTCCYCNPHEGCTLGIKPTQNKYKTMDEYEKELNKKGIYTKPKIKRDKAEDIVFGWMIECDGDLDKQSAKVLTDEIRLALADARKEERMKAEVETGLKNFKVTMEEISKARKEVGNGIEKMYLSVADEEPRYDTVEEIQAYNQAIYEILATLKEEK